MKNGCFGALTFQEIEIFDQLKYNLKLHESKELMLKSKLVRNYFMFVLLRPRRNDREKFQRKERHFDDFQAILK